MQTASGNSKDTIRQSSLESCMTIFAVDGQNTPASGTGVVINPFHELTVTNSVDEVRLTNAASSKMKQKETVRSYAYAPIHTASSISKDIVAA